MATCKTLIQMHIFFFLCGIRFTISVVVIARVRVSVRVRLKVLLTRLPLGV